MEDSDQADARVSEVEDAGQIGYGCVDENNQVIGWWCPDNEAGDDDPLQPV